MDDYNGDLKVLAEKIDAQSKKIDKIDEKIEPVCVMVIRHDEKITTNKEEIGKLRKKSDIWNSINSAAIMVSSAFSAFWKG